MSRPAGAAQWVCRAGRQPQRARRQERFVRAYLQAAEALREGAPGGAVAAGSAGGALAAGAEALRTAAEAFLPVRQPAPRRRSRALCMLRAAAPSCSMRVASV